MINSFFSKRNLVYFGLLFLAVLITIILIPSHAIFVKNNTVRDIGMVVGDLNYKMESEDIRSLDSVEVPKNDQFIFTIKLDNLNPVDMKYILYYNLVDLDTLPENVEIGYISETIDPVLGLITPDQGKSITLAIINHSSQDLTFSFGVETGFSYNELPLTMGVSLDQLVVPYYQDKSGANVPSLASNMIPVYYDSTAFVWRKADIYGEWYDYDNQWWANAVTVDASIRDVYLESKPGTAILMDNINTMWVWVPRYEYEAITSTTATEIKVNFLRSNAEVDENYIIPEGFNFKEEALKGIWIAKFEAGTSKKCTVFSVITGRGCDSLSVKSVVKPTITAWRGARLGAAETIIRNMVNEDNMYGFNMNETDTHITKNTEWILPAYLSQSKYGKYGSPLYEGANKEVAINNCSSYVTGIGGGTPDAGGSSAICSSGTYASNNGMAASTTGNVHGIYDMNGGVWEMVMGNLNNSVQSSNIASNYFPNNPDYFNSYTTSDILTACNSSVCLGHGLSETAGWYGDLTDFIKSGNPWLGRGGYYSSRSKGGVFSYDYHEGGTANDYGFRIALIVK